MYEKPHMPLRVLCITGCLAATISLCTYCAPPASAPSEPPAVEDDGWNPRPWTEEDEKAEEEVKKENSSSTTKSEEEKPAIPPEDLIDFTLTDAVQRMDVAMVDAFGAWDVDSLFPEINTEVPLSLEGEQYYKVENTWGPPTSTESIEGGDILASWDLGHIELPNLDSSHIQHCILYVQYDSEGTVALSWGTGEFDPEPTLPDETSVYAIHSPNEEYPIFTVKE